MPQTYTYFYQPKEVSSQFSYSSVDGKPNIVESLYKDAGKGSYLLLEFTFKKWWLFVVFVTCY